MTTAVALVIANMVGAGVFTTSGFALADLGRRDYVLLAWLSGGVLALCGALCYGALGRRLPQSGGEYYFLSRVFHPAAGFMAGWTSLLAGFTAPIAVAALVFGTYLVPGSPAAARWIGSGVIAAAAAMHGVRLRPGVAAQNVVVGLKLLMIAGLIAIGALRIEGPFDSPPAPSAAFDVGAFAVSLVWISFAYSGWNAAVYVAGEIRTPERLLPRALILATLTVTVLYLALNAVFLYSTDSAALSGRADIAALAAQTLGGEPLRRCVELLIALALFTSVSSMMMAGPRVYARMAADGLFPRAFLFRAEVPTASIALQGVLALVVLWIGELADLLGYVGFTLGLSAAATVVALMVLRVREGAARVPVPGYPLVPVVFVAAVLWSSVYMIVREPRQALLGILTLATGLPVYWLSKRRRVTSP